jgi:hypothetical protein
MPNSTQETTMNFCSSCNAGLIRSITPEGSAYNNERKLQAEEKNM